MEPILGYWIESGSQLYFARGPIDALPEHVAAFDSPQPGVTITPVTRHMDVAPYVITRDLVHSYGGTNIHYNKWTPESPVPLEHDHTGVVRFEVLDFAETKEEAEAICKQLRGN